MKFGLFSDRRKTQPRGATPPRLRASILHAEGAPTPPRFHASTPRAGAVRAGFTLIEMLVVMVILATLVSLGAIGVAKVIKGAEHTKRNAYTQMVESALMAYKNEHGTYPLPEAYSSNDASASFGTVTNNRPKDGNAEIMMLLYGRDANGKRDDAKRAYLTDSSLLYVCKNGRSVTKLDDALAGSGVSPNDMIGFLITMNKTGVSKYKRLSQTRAFAPLKISYDFDLDHASVSSPHEGSFSEVIQLH